MAGNCNSPNPYSPNPYAPGGPYSPGNPYCGDCYTGGPYTPFPSNPDIPNSSECGASPDPCPSASLTASAPCPNSICDDRFADLPPTVRMNMMGTVGRCAYRFENTKGFVVGDERGQFLTTRPCVPVPFLKQFQTNPADGQLLLDVNGNPLEGPVPGHDAIFVADTCGCMNRVQGIKGKRQHQVWDGQKFVFEEFGDGSNAIFLDPDDVPIVTGVCPGPLRAVLVPSSKTVVVDGLETIVSGYGIGATKADDIPIPVGVMQMWPGSPDNVPFGWALCDGSVRDVNVDPELFDAIGYGWGGGGNSFNLPDMRGLVPRGADLGSGRDPDSATRVAISPGGNTGNNAGSFQDDQIQCFGATYKKYIVSNKSITITSGPSTTVANPSNQYTDTDIVFVDAGCGDPKFGAETRMRNAYVNFIIFVGCPSAT